MLFCNPQNWVNCQDYPNKWTNNNDPSDTSSYLHWTIILNDVWCLLLYNYRFTHIVTRSKKLMSKNKGKYSRDDAFFLLSKMSAELLVAKWKLGKVTQDMKMKRGNLICAFLSADEIFSLFEDILAISGNQSYIWNRNKGDLLLSFCINGFNL